MTYAQNRQKRRAENRIARKKKIQSKSSGQPLAGEKSAATLARIQRRKVRREKVKVARMKKNN